MAARSWPARRRASAGARPYTSPTKRRCSSPDSRSNRWRPSGTTPIRRLISSPCVSTSSPMTFAEPLLGARSPVRMLMVVDLPAPLGPRNPKNEPSGTSSVSPSSAGRPLNERDSWNVWIACGESAMGPPERARIVGGRTAREQARRAELLERQLRHDRGVVARVRGLVERLVHEPAEPLDRAAAAGPVAEAARGDPVEPELCAPLGPAEPARSEGAERTRERVHLTQAREAHAQRGCEVRVRLPPEARGAELVEHPLAVRTAVGVGEAGGQRFAWPREERSRRGERRAPLAAVERVRVPVAAEQHRLALARERFEQQAHLRGAVRARAMHLEVHGRRGERVER